MTKEEILVKFSGSVPKTLRNFAMKHADVIQEISEKGIDGYWVYFKPGWVDRESGLHQIHEYTVAAVIRRFKLVIPEAHWKCPRCGRLNESYSYPTRCSRCGYLREVGDSGN